MSDWEDDLDEQLNDAKEEEKKDEKAEGFDGEDNVDSDEEKKEAAKAAAAAAAEKSKAPKKPKKNDFVAKYEEKQRIRAAKDAELLQQAAKLKGSNAAKGEFLSKAAEEDITN